MSRSFRAAYIMALLPIPAAAQQASPTPSKIATVEQGLTSAVVLAGAPAPRRTIEAEMRRLNVPGVSVAVLHGGVIDWSKGYGVTRANGAPVTPVTRFQAGSISKPITALTALRLVQQHRLTLDGDVNTQLRGWKLPTAPSEHVTLRELLSHTAGTTVHGPHSRKRTGQRDGRRFPRRMVLWECPISVENRPTPNEQCEQPNGCRYPL